MPQHILTDISRDTWTDRFEQAGKSNSKDSPRPWSIIKSTLRGGRREGVDLIRLDNGRLAVDILATRGMSVWRGQFGDDRLGWDSPVTDGPVHPSFVRPADLGGFGWLEGFDELLVRCGLEHNGPPLAEAPFAHGLHGRIGNIPARRVAVETPESDGGVLAVEGDVDEARLFGPSLRLSTRYETEPGSNRLSVRDTFTNLGNSPARLVALYHWNFGPPYLGKGSRFAAPVAEMAPQTPRAAEGVTGYDVYGPPQPGFAEQVYLFELIGDGPAGRTLVMLRNAAGDKAVVLRYSTAQLPCFSLWKNERGVAEGYVTGLEPATNYPNSRSFEGSHGRYVELPPGATHVTETTLEVLDSADQIVAVEKEIRELASGASSVIHRAPVEPFAPGR